MKNLFAVLSTVVLTAVAFAGVTIGLNVITGLQLTADVAINGLILGGLLGAGSWFVTALTGRTSRNPLCFGFAMAFAAILALAVRIHFDVSAESLIPYGAIAVIGFISGLVGSAFTRLMFGPPAPKA
jgi:hypothetical protein